MDSPTAPSAPPIAGPKPSLLLFSVLVVATCGLVYELITATMFAAPIYTYYGRNIATDVHAPPNFRTPLGLKDVTQMIDSAAALGVPMPLGELLQDQLRQALDAGYADLDWSAMTRVAARAAGLPTK